MPDKKISELTAGAALTGSELVAAVQAGVTVKTTAQEIADLAAGTTLFTGLTDTPANYTGAAGLAAVVNPGETGLQFSAAGVSTFQALTDTPADFTSGARHLARINTAQTALEFSLDKALPTGPVKFVDATRGDSGGTDGIFDTLANAFAAPLAANTTVLVFTSDATNIAANLTDDIVLLSAADESVELSGTITSSGNCKIKGFTISNTVTSGGGLMKFFDNLVVSGGHATTGAGAILTSDNLYFFGDLTMKAAGSGSIQDRFIGGTVIPETGVLATAFISGNATIEMTAALQQTIVNCVIFGATVKGVASSLLFFRQCNVNDVTIPNGESLEIFGQMSMFQNCIFDWTRSGGVGQNHFLNSYVNNCTFGANYIDGANGANTKFSNSVTEANTDSLVVPMLASNFVFASESTSFS